MAASSPDISCSSSELCLGGAKAPAKLPRGFLGKMNKVASDKVFVEVLAGLKSLSANPNP